MAKNDNGMVWIIGLIILMIILNNFGVIDLSFISDFFSVTPSGGESGVSGSMVGVAGGGF